MVGKQNKKLTRGTAKDKALKVSFKKKTVSSKNSKVKIKKSKDKSDETLEKKGKLNHVHHIHKKLKKNFKSLPKGMRILLQFNAILAIFYLFLIIFSVATIFFGVLIEGMEAMFIHFIYFVSIMYILLGISYRKKVAYYLMIALYGFAIVNSIVSMFLISGINDNALLSIGEMFIPFLIFLTIVDGICLWYMSNKLKYFVLKTKKEAYKETWIDRSFVRIIYGLYTTVIVSFFIIIIVFTTTTLPILNPILESISGKQVTEALAFCYNDDLTIQQKDLCYLSVVVIYPEENSLDMLCKKIDNGFYRFTCYNKFKK